MALEGMGGGGLEFSWLMRSAMRVELTGAELGVGEKWEISRRRGQPVQPSHFYLDEDGDDDDEDPVNNKAIFTLIHLCGRMMV